MEIECFLSPLPPVLLRQSAPPSRFLKSKSVRKKKMKMIKASANNIHQDFFRSAISRASLRFQETLRPDPLFVDPYAACFAPPNNLHSTTDHNYNYCIATRFIDDHLITVTKGVDGAKQVVLFTDGMDTRPYRLNWPSSTLIYHLSPQAVFNKASQLLQDVGAKIPRSCLLLHVPLESSDMQQVLTDKGFNGCRPSIWVFQGFPVANLASFKDILSMVGNLAMKGCLFLGELPVCLTETLTQAGIKTPVEKWMDELFMGYGFRVRIIGYDGVARNLGQEREVAGGDPDNLLFVAEHLRFSDGQMENWRREFQRMQEQGDEEGFEEL